MNRLEAAARPHLTRMMQGLPVQLSEDEQEIVARWIAVKTVVGENKNRSQAVTPATDRRALMLGKIPAYFSIYIGQHDGGQVGYYRSSHTVARSATRPSDEQVDNIGASKNIQSTTFTIGQMFAHINANTGNVRVEDVVVAIGVYDKMCLWPVSKPVFSWPPGPVVPESILTTIAKALNNATTIAGRWV